MICFCFHCTTIVLNSYQTKKLVCSNFAIKSMQNAFDTGSAWKLNISCLPKSKCTETKVQKSAIVQLANKFLLRINPCNQIHYLTIQQSTTSFLSMPGKLRPVKTLNPGYIKSFNDD